jgi:hypothetical protein
MKTREPTISLSSDQSLFAAEKTSWAASRSPAGFAHKKTF